LNEAAVSEVSSKLLEVGVVLQGGALDAYECDALNAHRRRISARARHLAVRIWESLASAWCAAAARYDAAREL